ncbi:nucleobase:cation symporter-2 family protein [Alicyclobacillus sp. SO9]|uniref:nucleobase:cation symporter-2 family protein n=1 Tax=Alicyclobacillus sp. SO9 TaxID=2665646 RepID=UPI0018E75088|nr:nucleobase:cation symporter-2 family protein [Alicyclobacillus sp. SO9]QQE79843.1 purine permease [Alicyclobacillus sp. SO9]
MLSKSQVFTLGLQHVLAMYAGAVVVPILIGSSLKFSSSQMTYLIAADLFTCGIATLLQVIGNRFIGIKLPVVLGATFTAVSPIIAIGKTTNIGTIFGSIIIAGIAVFLLAPLFGMVLKLFPTVVTGSVVTIIGLTLIPVAMGNAAGGQGSPSFGAPHNLILALGTLLIILVMNRYLRGFLRAISILMGLILGTLAGALLGIVKFSPVLKASWFNIVHPFYFGQPHFNLIAIITMIIVGIVSMVESTGVYFALSQIVEKPIGQKDIVKGLRAEGIAIVLGGIFNTFPYTTFSQNVGLVSLTRVKTRNVIVAAGGILVALGLLPKVAALTTVIPDAVLGGAMIAMFGMVVAYGANILSQVNFNDNNNLLVVACSIGVGLGSATMPQMFAHLPNMLQMLLQNGIVTGSVTAVALNLFLNGWGATEAASEGTADPETHNRSSSVTAGV